MSLLGDTWSFYEANRGFVDGAIRTHVTLSTTALAIAAAIGVALGVACAKLGRAASFVVVTIANLGRTVPTFAIMALAVALSSLGRGPAVVGLVALGVPPILESGLNGAPPPKPDPIDGIDGPPRPAGVVAAGTDGAAGAPSVAA